MAGSRIASRLYEILSDVAHGKITARVKMPARSLRKAVCLRFRHPKAARIKSVTVDGKPWLAFDRDKETIELTGVTGTITVVASYSQLQGIQSPKAPTFSTR